MTFFLVHTRNEEPCANHFHPPSPLNGPQNLFLTILNTNSRSLYSTPLEIAPESSDIDAKVAEPPIKIAEQAQGKHPEGRCSSRLSYKDLPDYQRLLEMGYDDSQTPQGIPQVSRISRTDHPTTCWSTLDRPTTQGTPSYRVPYPTGRNGWQGPARLGTGQPEVGRSPGSLAQAYGQEDEVRRNPSKLNMV